MIIPNKRKEVRLLEIYYFEWLCRIAIPNDIYRRSYKNLLLNLHKTDFIYTNTLDKNRADDGMEMRTYYIDQLGHPITDNIIRSFNMAKCSVLEVMVALATRIERSFLLDFVENKTSVWFAVMMDNLKISSLTDRLWSSDEFHNRMDIFLNRKYSFHGEGALFSVKNPREDLRAVDIWYQMSWYVNEQIESFK